MDETDLTCNKTLQLLHFELPRPFDKKQRSTCKHAGRITHSYTLETQKRENVRINYAKLLPNNFVGCQLCD